MMPKRSSLLLAAALAGAGLNAAPAAAQELTLYSGRGESLVAPLIEMFEEQSGIAVEVRYGGTAEMAVLIQEEGDASPADIFWAQDPGALGAVGDLFAPMPDNVLANVPEQLRDDDGRWVAASARARTFIYSPERVGDDEMPASIADLADEQYRGRVGWAPTNGSFQAHLTALRVLLGEEETKAWLEAMIANDTQIYSNNGSQLQAVADGEIDFGLVNHYYLLRQKASDAAFPVDQSLFEDGDAGNLLMAAGVGVLASSDQPEEARQFVEFLLSEEAQSYFAQDNQEFAITEGADNSGIEPSIEDVLAASPDLDLNDIDDLEGTLDLLREVGLL
ncbi:iron ABC transporter substrate-binding protein [Pararhizobium haloflavum]|uniref:iron ABC transporter substrate-binding protein n=1 Tax=Pararhizobium haloflavum TaxID=2037914 RepID=UPI001AECFE16|nr:iron ABC transporter substrate-binding protein [Pararhizobium haloflavum]